MSSYERAEKLCERLQSVDGADGVSVGKPFDESDDEILIGGYVSPEGREQAQSILEEYDWAEEGASYEVDEFEWFLSVDVR